VHIFVFRALPLALLATLAVGCSSPPAGSDGGLDGGMDAGVDAGPTDAGPPWPHDLPPTTDLGDRRGRFIARTIVHLHSPLSHDACDGAGWVDGGLAAPECLEHLRTAACTLQMDTLMLTDHAPYVDEVPFDQGYWAAAGDEVVTAGADTVAVRWVCPDGHRVLVTVGSENEMMPIGLRHHPSDPADPVALLATYDADGAAAAATFRAAGGLVWYAHTEGHTLDQLRATHPDGIEIYNTHANVDPNIRMNDLGLPAVDFLPTLLRFTTTASLESDLSFLSFYSENGNALAKFDTLLSEGWHITGTGGCDAHENTFTQLMPDGERGDSYRRIMRWHTNHVLVSALGDRDAVVEALGAGRSYLAFEALGTPVGFDFLATDAGGVVAEMGGDTTVGATLRLVRPSLPPGFPADPPPTMRMRILRAAAGGAVEVAQGTGDLLEHTITDPGAYRAEILIVPNHTRPYLGTLADRLIHEVVWVYSNAIHAL